MTVQERRRAEFAIRAKRLTQFCYADYSEYIRSRHWKLTRSAYFAHPDASKRCLCGEADERFLHLHHKTYVRIGAEDLRDLQPMCGACHQDVHLAAKHGLAPFDLADYADEDRRRSYARERQAGLARRGEGADGHPDTPYDDFNWRAQAHERHVGAQDRRELAHKLARQARRAA